MRECVQLFALGINKVQTTLLVQDEVIAGVICARNFVHVERIEDIILVYDAFNRL